jgi:peptidoglycan-N-acetylmuramic acid deacetylase
MKKRLIRLMSIIIVSALLCAVFNTAVSANAKLINNKNYSWYFKRVPDNRQPDFDVDIEDLKRYDAYTIGSADDKVIYLTFDFGYENGNVKKCLDALNNNDVKGAFFILDHVIRNDTDLIKEIAETGHIVANHTMKHKNMCYVKDFAEYEKELAGLEQIYEELIGQKMAKFYRPPKGEFTKQNLEYNKKLGFKTIFWSVAYKDWDDKSQPNHAESIKKILNMTHNGAVVLLHPTSNTNAEIIDSLIKEWKKLGYRFGTLDELK